VQLKSLLAVGVVAVVLCGSQNATAQIVAGTSGYAGGAAPTVSPTGIATVDKKLQGLKWRVSFDFGTLNGGGFTPLPVAAGGGLPANIAIASVPVVFAGGAPVAWAVPGPPAPIKLGAGWPVAANTVFLQIKLQWNVAGNFWVDANTIYVGAP
jgi:hypothetical protein